MTVKRTYTDLGREAVSTAARVAARLDELKRINVELKTENTKLREFAKWVSEAMSPTYWPTSNRFLAANARIVLDEIGEEKILTFSGLSDLELDVRENERGN